MFRLLSLAFLLAPLSLAACGDDDGGNVDPDPDAGVDPDAAPPVEEIPLERAQAGGAPAAISIAGDRAYVVIGPRLTVWDVSDPAAPALVGETAPIQGAITDVAVSGDHAYLAEHVDLDGRVHVVDVSNPAAPSVAASFRVAEEGAYTIPLGVDVAGGKLYVADQEHGVSIYDLTDPTAPALEDTIEQGGVSDVKAIGDRLYVVARGFIGGTSVDILDATNAYQYLGGVGTGAIGVTVTEDNLVIGIGAYGVEVWDVTDPANPVDRYRNEELQSRAVAATGSVAWLPAETGLYRLDLAGKTPSLLGPLEVDTTQSNAAVVTDGLFAVITQRGTMVAVDLAGETPAVGSVTDISLCGDCIGVDVVGEALFVSDIVGGLRTADVKDLDALGRGKPEGFVVFEDVDVAGDHAYVADWNHGLRIFDVSDVAAPALVGSLATGYASAVRYQDGHAYVGESTNGGIFRVIDVRDPAAPEQVSALVTTKTLDLELQGSYAYLADGSLDGPGMLRIVDISDPAAPEVVGSYTGCSEVMDVAVAGDLALIACSFDGFRLLDVSDPTSPTELGSWTPPSPAAAEAVALDGARAYLGHSFGVAVADISDPANPEVDDSRTTAGGVRALHAPVPGRIVASCGNAGVYQWQLDVP